MSIILGNAIIIITIQQITNQYIHDSIYELSVYKGLEIDKPNQLYQTYATLFIIMFDTNSFSRIQSNQINISQDV